MDKEQIISKLEENKEKIKNLSVKKMGLFGSYMKNKETKDSDLDILVEFEVTNADNYFELLYLLEKIFNNKKIDLVIESGLKPEVLYVKDEAQYVEI